VARLTPNDWIRAAARQMATAGVDSVRVERLSKDLKVSKGSFYWHFSDRAALLAAVLTTWEQDSTLAVIADLERHDEDPKLKLWALFEEAFGAPAEHDALEAAIRTWASRDDVVKKVVRRVDRRRLRFVSDLLSAAGLPPAEASRRAELLYCALIGESVRRTYGQAKLSRKGLRSLHSMLLMGT